MNTPINDDDQKLTKREEAHLKELERLGESLEQANLMYGSALDGMEPGLKAASEELDSFGLDAKLSAADDELAEKAVAVLEGDVRSMAAMESELNEDDDEEDGLLADDEGGPQETAV